MPPCVVRERFGASATKNSRRSEQVHGAEEAVERVALLVEQCGGTVTVASCDEVAVIEDMARQRERVASGVPSRPR